MKARKRDPRLYLEDILSGIGRIEVYTVDGKAMFFEDEKTQDAVIRQISIIGEAASKLPASLRAAQPSVPWKKIVGMRNIVIHDYAETDLPTVWLVVERDLPSLGRAIRVILSEKRAA